MKREASKPIFESLMVIRIKGESWVKTEKVDIQLNKEIISVDSPRISSDRLMSGFNISKFFFYLSLLKFLFF